MEKCDKHQHKQRNNLKELGKWKRQGQKCESSWKNANGYVWGKIIHKPDIHWAENLEAHLRIEKSALKCLLLTVARPRWGGQARREWAWKVGGLYKKPTYRVK